uniref:G protein-coupled receptor n=1 Tax=Parascaris univalens TaxID=6257 RepID=A0A915ANR5_PARUN
MLTLSDATKEMHRRLMKVLTLQAAVPVVFIFPPIFVSVLQQIGLFRTPVVEYLIFALVSIIPSVDALLTLYCVRPYREAIVWFFCHCHYSDVVHVVKKPSSANNSTTNERFAQSKPTIFAQNGNNNNMQKSPAVMSSLSRMHPSTTHQPRPYRGISSITNSCYNKNAASKC